MAVRRRDPRAGRACSTTSCASSARSTGTRLKHGQLAGIGARQEQQVAHQPPHARGFVFSFDDGFATRCLRDPIAPQERQVPANDRDRVAQLMRRVGQQATL